MWAAPKSSGAWLHKVPDLLRRGDLLTRLARRGPFVLPLLIGAALLLGVLCAFLPALVARAILLKRDGRQCPKCGAHDVRLSTTATLYDIPFRCLSLTAMRCRPCRTRFYVPAGRK